MTNVLVKGKTTWGTTPEEAIQSTTTTAPPSSSVAPTSEAYEPAEGQTSATIPPPPPPSPSTPSFNNPPQAPPPPSSTTNISQKPSQAKQTQQSLQEQIEATKLKKVPTDTPAKPQPATLRDQIFTEMKTKKLKPAASRPLPAAPPKVQTPRESLLNQIRAGAQLKKVAPATSGSSQTQPQNPSKAQAAQGSLFDQIRAGKQLKKATSAAPASSQATQQQTSTDDLAAALGKRRQSLEEPDIEDEEETSTTTPVAPTPTALPAQGSGNLQLAPPPPPPPPVESTQKKARLQSTQQKQVPQNQPPAENRNALLDQIKEGKQLKKVTTPTKVQQPSTESAPAGFNLDLVKKAQQIKTIEQDDEHDASAWDE